MKFLTYALLILWLPACLTALVFLVRPSRRWPVFGTRPRALLMLVAFVFGVPVVAALIAPESMRAKPGEATAGAPPATATSPTQTSPTQTAPTQTAAAESGDEVVSHPEYYLELSQAKAVKAKGGRVILGGKITNAAARPIRNPRVECYLSKGKQSAGTVAGSVRKTIPAGGEVAFAAVDLGAAEGAWDHQICKITGAEVAG
ncbi:MULTISPECIES: hypothetical protein [unclassified Caulobacter]|uniref:hypothetical protein n=1 Tax=unclassified Caulobacter TaxID=2648921 RepID=UPI0006FA73D6|nr:MULTISPECIES: hypothetical protein [unclassified Caulobacter]KQV55270.1 hypothetical protein ASC62_21820 [Caulobacter sp. Root342]KQV63541.1 hypothetical protein ASC70_20825 [Caulobacter sp. Root343]